MAISTLLYIPMPYIQASKQLTVSSHQVWIQRSANYSKIKEMEVKSLVSSSSSSAVFPYSPHPLLSCSLQQCLNNRRLFFLPPAVNPQRCGVGIKHKSLRFCPKSNLRGNLEVTGVPTSVPVRVAIELLQAGHRYLDVRTLEEFSAGHAAGAINVPYMYRVGSGMAKNPKFLEEVSLHFRKHDEIIVGCQSGKRSHMAATLLLAAGFTAVTDIAGGFVAWTQNALPTEN